MKRLLLLLGLFSAGIFGPPAGGLSIASAQNAVLYFVPTSSTVSPGQTFRVQVMVDTKGEFVNAVAAYFMYPADKLDALFVDRTGSAMTLFAEDKALLGRVDISGGTPTPGFLGIQKIASVDFRVKESYPLSPATLNFLSDAAILRNSDNQNILNLGSSGKATFLIVQTAPPLPSTPTPTPTPISQPDPSPQPAAITISDIRAEELGEGNVRVSWNTSEETAGAVHYGVLSQGTYKFSVFDGEFVKEHLFVLSNIELQEGYSLEIVGVDRNGKEIKAERLDLEELLDQQGQQKPSRVVEGGIEIGGFEIRFPILIAFVLLPMLVILAIAFMLFSRMRARGG